MAEPDARRQSSPEREQEEHELEAGLLKQEEPVAQPAPSPGNELLSKLHPAFFIAYGYDRIS